MRLGLDGSMVSLILKRSLRSSEIKSWSSEPIGKRCLIRVSNSGEFGAKVLGMPAPIGGGGLEQAERVKAPRMADFISWRIDIPALFGRKRYCDCS